MPRLRDALVLAPDSTGRTRTVDVDTFLEWVSAQPRDAGLAVDTETAGLGWNDAVRTVQFGNSERGFAVVADRGGYLVKEAFARYRGPLIFHNAAFDVHALERIGLDPEYLWPRILDTHVLAHVLQPDRVSFKLKMLATMELGYDAFLEQKTMSALKRKRGWTWENIPLLLLTPYAVEDVLLTHRLYTKFCADLSDDEWKVVDKEMEVAWAGGIVEHHAMRLDLEYARGLDAEWGRQLDALTTQMASYPLAPQRCPRCQGSGKTPKATRDCSLCAGTGIEPSQFLDNPNADAQIARALMLQGWQPTTFTEKAQKPKLDKKVLESLEGEYELARLVLEYRHLNKWREAYVVNCLEAADADGYVHASYNTLGAKTGRMSCSNPPLQQLPKGGGGVVRRMFIASPGNLIASCDYSAIEFRLAGALSGEPRIIDVYKAGGDWYQQVADDLGITRQQAKVFVLATLYGAQAAKHALVFGWAEAYAEEVVNDFWRKYPKLARWNAQVKGDARSGRPIQSMWGRNLSPKWAGAAVNALIQGTAAEVLKNGIMRLWQKGFLKYVCAIVHDEVVLDVPHAEAEDITASVAEILYDDSFACPLVAEGTVYGASWGAGYAA